MGDASDDLVGFVPIPVEILLQFESHLLGIAAAIRKVRLSGEVSIEAIRNVEGHCAGLGAAAKKVRLIATEAAKEELAPPPIMP